MDLIFHILRFTIRKYFGSILLVFLFFTSSILSANTCFSLFTECLTNCEYKKIPKVFKELDSEGQIDYSNLTLKKIRTFLNIYQKRLNKVAKDMANIQEPTMQNTVLYLERILSPITFLGYFIAALAANNPEIYSDALYQEIAARFVSIKELFLQNTQILNNILRIHSMKNTLNLSEDEKLILDLYYDYIYQVYLDDSSSKKDKKTDSSYDLVNESTDKNTNTKQLKDSTVNSSTQRKIKRQSDTTEALRLKISTQLSEFMSTHYVTISSKSYIAKFPPDYQEIYSQIAQEIKQNGNILLIPLEDIDYLLSSLDDRDLREKLYKARLVQLNSFYTRISKKIKTLTTNLDRLSQLQYHTSFIQSEFYYHFIPDHKLLLSLLSEAFPLINEKVSQTLQNLEDFANNIKPESKPKIKLKPWDIEYYNALYQEFIYDHFYPELRPYLEYNSVLDGILKVFSKLHSVTIVPRDNLHTFSNTSRVYEVFDSSSTSRGLLHIDYSITESSVGGYPFTIPLQPKVNIINFNPVVAVFFKLFPKDISSSLYLSVRDIRIMFHELGHALHFLLYNSGISFNLPQISLPEDYKEFPSKFMEHFVLDPNIIKMYAKHEITHEPIPDRLLKNFEYFSINHAFSTLAEILGAYLDVFLFSSKFKDISSILKKFKINEGIDLYIISSLYISITNYSLLYYSYFLGNLLGSNLFYYIKNHGIFSPTSKKMVKSFLDESIMQDMSSYFKLIKEYPDLSVFIDTISTK